MSIWNRLFGSSTGDVETESRSWMVKCPCGFERSIWELGGVRYGAASKGKRMLRRCVQCGKFRWHSVYRKAAEPVEEKPLEQ